MAKRRTFFKGSARRKDFDNGGHVINFSLNLSECFKMMKKINELRTKEGSDATDYLSLTLASKDTDEYGNDYSIMLNDWTYRELFGDAEEVPAKKTTKKSKSEVSPDEPTDDLPF